MPNYKKQPALTEEEARKYNIPPDDIALMDRSYFHVQDMCLFNDIFMKYFFSGQKDIAEKMLRIIMEKKDLRVLSLQTEKQKPNIMGLSPCLDIECVDDEGTVYDIEVQNRVDAEEIPHRTRFYAAVETGTQLPKGSRDYSGLRVTVIIFILRTWIDDTLAPMYHIDRRYRELKDEKNNNLLYGDGEQIILVNGQNLDCMTELGRLMHDFSCTRGDEMEYDWIGDRMSSIKNTRSTIMDIAQEDLDRYAKAAEEARKECILGMLKENLGIEMISRITRKSVEYILEVQETAQKKVE